ncbi:hypothetical protein CARUB_v10002826mg, partial [Capsella rubella]
MTSSFSETDQTKQDYQVFINFRGEELRTTFVSQLHQTLRRVGINAFIDTDERKGENLQNLFKRIEDSEVALAIISSRYTESIWCLDELVKIKECVDRKSLWVIPVFYKLEPRTVQSLDGEFGIKLWNSWRDAGRDDRIGKWDAALQDVRQKIGYVLNISEEETTFLSKIVSVVKNALSDSKQQSQKTEAIAKPQKCLNILSTSSSKAGEEQRLKQLEEKLDVECNDNKTRVVAIVGMAGIGKTYLAKKLYEKLQKKIVVHMFICFGNGNSKEHGRLQRTISRFLKPQCDGLKKQLSEEKSVVVLDNVSDQKEINALVERIKEGSRVVITTRDKSLLHGLACDVYEVPGLNDRDSLELFQSKTGMKTLEGNFMELSRKLVDCSGGNPCALKEFGEELNGKDEGQWEARLGTLTKCFGKELRICYDELNEQQKDAFLDIAYFFRSHDESYIRSLLDSAEAGKELIDLADKFLIQVFDGRVEMHDLLLAMAKELVVTTAGKYMLLSSEVSTALKKKEGRENVRGIVIDMSNVEEMPLYKQTFVGMSSLRYLKIFNSVSEADCKLNLPDGLEFPKNIVRYFHWMRFPLQNLPSDFEPENLIDLTMPYSQMTHLWDNAKVFPKLKWVDLSYSSKLSSLLGLSDAPYLLRLNLEGCTSLKELPVEMQNMKNLVFLNLRGCTSLLSLPSIKIHSLKVLILSGCSNFRKFWVISENLETLYLNGTAIDELPPAIGNLHSLILLNLKDCKKLATLPDCLGRLKSLQELKLSRCSELKIFPEVEEMMKSFRVLLLDGTSITKIPDSVNNFAFLRRLCLSRNDAICSIQIDMSQLFHLKWVEVKYCKNLKSLTRLPPNLHCLNAYGCTSLRTVATPLALLMPTDQIHSTLIFTNCHELEQASIDSIISYVQNKSKLMSIDRYNQDFVFQSLIGTCFPGGEIPTMFNHRGFGSVLKLDLPQDWNAGRIIGIALCVVVSFKEYKGENKSLQVKCTCEFTNVSMSPESFVVGGWSEPGSEPHTVEPDHIFIGYTTLFNIKKLQHFSSATEASLRFEVTNGTHEAEECKVTKCGFSLVYKHDEADNTSWKETPRMENG